MNVFDKFINSTEEIVENYKAIPLQTAGVWPIAAKNPFLMNRDTAVELGGYPKESINLLIGSQMPVEDGCKIIGDPSIIGTEGHVSFGKVVLLETDEISDDKAYDFTQLLLITDSHLRFENVMLRTSSAHYLTNYKIGKIAIDKGFNLPVMASSIRQSFLNLPEVKKVEVVLIIGESNIYKELLPIAETVKEATVALNHIFDGIEMNCSHCDFSEVCSEIDGLKEMHQKRAGLI